MTHSCDALVVGAGGFVGGHLVRSLLEQGLQVRAVDVRPTTAWTQLHEGAENLSADTTRVEVALAAVGGATTVYHLATALPGATHADRVLGAMVDAHLLIAARESGVDRFLYVGAAAATDGREVPWRRTIGERTARHLHDDHGLAVRIVRLGAVFGAGDAAGPGAPVVATVTRLVAAALLTGRTRVEIPFRSEDPAAQVYVDDAVLGVQLVTHGTEDCVPYDVADPAPTTVGDVVAAVLAVAQVPLVPVFTGGAVVPAVAGDAAALERAVDWQPGIPLRTALERYLPECLADARRTLALPPSISDRLAARRAGERRFAGSVGKHRYANAG